MGIPAHIRSRLPTAKLFYAKMRLNRDIPVIRPIWWAKFRNANSMFVWVGPFEIGWRMPWLERSARQLHPHLFQQEQAA